MPVKMEQKPLHSRLVEVDEKAASQIHFNNVKRVIRALEFYYQTGKKNVRAQ